MKSLGLFIFRVFVGVGILALVGMLYWSSLLLEKETKTLEREIAKTKEELKALRYEVAKGRTPDVARLQEDARQGEHLLLLMQLENDEEAATDAVSLLTQLRKEVSKRACG